MRSPANAMVDGWSSDTAYRRDIDGLRAVAVLAVIGFHAGLAGFAGGYVGVDVFFVISGFVITRLIVRDLQAGSFTLWGFYERRFRRILPALSLVLLACLLPAWYWMLPDQLVAFAASVACLLLLVPNVYFWRNTSYFNAASEDHPLLHTWSLGIEEQFYVGFAMLLLLSWRFGRRRTLLTLTVLCLSSLLLCEVVRRQASVAAFYLLPFRAWELLVGSLASRLAGRAGSTRWLPGRLARSIPWLALASLMYSIVSFDARTPFPSLWTLVPVLATAALLAVTPSHHVVSRGLGCKPLVGIGLISYSAYLWHYPVFTFAELAWLQTPDVYRRAGLIVLVMAAAALSWRWVEQPARRANVQFGWVAACVTLCLIVVGAFCWVVWSQAGAPQRLSAEAIRLLGYANNKNPRQSECLATTDHPRSPDKACVLGRKEVQSQVALIGDSHADALFVALDEALNKAGLGGRFMAYSGCPPVPQVLRSDMGDSSHCHRYFQAVYRELQQHPEIQTVILAARWSTYLEGEPFDNLEGGREPGRAMAAKAASALPDVNSSDDPADRAVALGFAYRQGIERLVGMGKRVLVVYPIPEVGWDVPHWLALHEMRGRPLRGDLSTSRSAYDRRNRRLELAFDKLEWDSDKLIAIRPAGLFCDTVERGRCMAELHGIPLYYDTNHLGRMGADKVVAAISAAAGWTSSTPVDARTAR